MESSSAQKLVVLGIPYSLGTDDLSEYMSKFGEIDQVAVLTEKGTQRSRGFGFVTFKDQAVADAVLGTKHSLGGRDLEVKVAIPKDAMSSQISAPPSKALATRIFVGKIPATVTDERFKIFFENFGTVVDSYMPMNPQTSKHRGIGFVTYADAASVDIAMSEPRVMDGVEIAVDRATPKVNQGPKAQPMGGGMMHGAGGGDGMRRPAPNWGGYYDPASERDRDGQGLDVPPTPPLASRFMQGPSGGHYSPMYAAPLPGGRQDPASPGFAYAHTPMGAKPVHPTKIFVGKLSVNTGAEDLKEYFSRFGPIRDVYVPRDAAKSGHRGFGFVTFEEEEVAAFVAKRPHIIKGVQVATDRASPQEVMGGGAKGGEASAPALTRQRAPSPQREPAYPGSLVGYGGHQGGGAPAHSAAALNQEQYHAQLAAYYGLSAQLGAETTQDWMNGGYAQHAARNSSGRDVRYRPY